MAALSPAHFLLWARLTTASPAPSVTPSEGTNRRTRVGVSSSTCPRRKSYLSDPPFLGPQVSICVCVSVCLCVCVCVCVIPALCVWGLAQLPGSLSLSLPLFLPLSITRLLYPSASPPPSRRLDGGHELRESRDQYEDNRALRPGS